MGTSGTLLGYQFSVCLSRYFVVNHACLLYKPFPTASMLAHPSSPCFRHLSLQKSVTPCFSSIPPNFFLSLSPSLSQAIWALLVLASPMLLQARLMPICPTHWHPRYSLQFATLHSILFCSPVILHVGLLALPFLFSSLLTHTWIAC